MQEASGRAAALMTADTRRAVRSLLFLLALAANSVAAGAADGHLVLAGGGSTPEVVFSRTLAISGGRNAIVAVLPQTFPDDSIGDAAVALWRQAGAREVVKVSRLDPAAAQAAIRKATLIWMPGGFQGLLMTAIEGTPIAAEIRARFSAGVTIGGASAGAAAMSKIMIADESTANGAAVDGARTSAGLGLWPEAIVSVHFTERRRINPLRAIVRDHPTLLGVGLDEGTAVFVSGGSFAVVGRGTVTVVDPRGRDLDRPSVRTLSSGMRFRYRD